MAGYAPGARAALVGRLSVELALDSEEGIDGPQGARLSGRESRSTLLPAAPDRGRSGARIRRMSLANRAERAAFGCLFCR